MRATFRFAKPTERFLISMLLMVSDIEGMGVLVVVACGRSLQVEDLDRRVWGALEASRGLEMLADFKKLFPHMVYLRFVGR